MRMRHLACGLAAWGAAWMAGAAETAILPDPPPDPRQKPVSPADGQTVGITPPPFLWAPAKQDGVYTLQISRAQDFPEQKTLAWRGLRRPVFVPCETLEAGRWFWRYGLESDRGTTFSRTRSFTVAADARPFPFPKWDEVIARVPTNRPRLFFPGPKLEQARAWAKGPLKKDVDRLVSSCLREVGRELVPEPGPRPKDDGYGPWAVRIMRTTRPPMDVMERCALAWLLTGDRRLGGEARRRVLHFFSWDPNGSSSLSSYDEPPMWMMMRGTRAYDWTYDLFTPEERARIEANMKVRAGQFLSHLRHLPFESRPYDSHAGRMPGFLGECALSFVHEWPEARDWLDYATLLYYTSYPAWGGDDGGWQEGPGYWSAYMGFALHYVVALREAAGVDLMQKTFFRNTPYFALYTATPYHQFLPFGDGQTGSPAGLGGLLYAFSSLTYDPYIRWYAETAGADVGTDVLSLSTYDPSLKARSPRELPPARSFPAVGLASFHTALGDASNDVSFLLRSSPYGGVSHGHADQNAFDVEAYGRGLAIATGYYPWYGSPHHVQWTRATRAVNSVLVDGHGQVAREWGLGGRLAAFESTAGYDFAHGDAARAYDGRLDRFDRRVVHVRPGVFVICDDLAAPQPSRFQWLLHACRRIGVEAADRTLRITNAPAAMTVRLLLPERVEFTQTDRYEPEPEMTAKGGTWSNPWHLSAASERARQARFLAVLMPCRTGAEDRLPAVRLLRGAGADGVELKAQDGTRDVVAFRSDRAAKNVSCGGVESPAQVFAEGWDRDGRSARRFSYVKE